MITDELLERGLDTIGDSYDVPPHAVDDILAQLRPTDATLADDDADVRAAHRLWPPARRTWLLSSAAALVVLVIVAFAVGGGGGNRPAIKSQLQQNTSVDSAGSGGAAEPNGFASGAKGAAPAPAPVPVVPQTSSAGGIVTSSRQPSTTVAPDSLTRIVQTGEIDLQVDKVKVNDAVAALTKYVRGIGGIVANSQSVDGDGAPSASVTLRVPERSFADLLLHARGLGKVLSEETKSADVTAQYVDLQARLRALGLTKSTYLRILTRASTIGEILSVQQQVNDVQTQIEQLQGQLKVLTDQSTYATLTVSIDQKAKVKPAAVVHHQSGMSRAVHRSVSRFVHGIEAIVGAIGPIVLVLLLLGLGWLFARVGYRIVRRQMV